MNTCSRSSRAFFEAKYAESEDPWRFASSSYELGRYRATLDFLLRPSYRRGFEPGCSVGVLTAALAQRCRRLVSCDISGTAVALAAKRCRHISNVEICRCDVAAGLPPGSFDLIVFSELGYYFSPAVLGAVVGRMADRLEPGGEFIAAHWLGHSPDHVLHGDDVHAVLAQTLSFERTGSSRHVGYRIDAWRRAP